jgi:hypothetical protein
MIYEAGLVISAVAGCLAIVLGNRTAVPLMAGLVFSLFAGWLGVPFTVVLWMFVDSVMMLGIIAFVWRRATWFDAVIVGLFFPAWVLYQMEDPLRCYGTTAIVTLQFLLTLLATGVLARVRLPFFKGTEDKNNMELVAA